MNARPGATGFARVDTARDGRARHADGTANRGRETCAPPDAMPLPMELTPDPIRIDTGPVRIDGRQALDALRLTLTERRIGIVGRNGSGKTTLMRLISGLVAPESGTVRLGDTDPMADRAGTLHRIGILFQNPDHQILFPTVEEELAFGLRQQGMAQSDALTRARTTLDAEGRAHWATRPTSTLSGGERHYLCLLAILMMTPGTILLDEPFAGLDVPTAARLARRLRALAQRVVIISHDSHALAGMERVIWLARGRVVADGAADAVLAEFDAEMTRLGELDAEPDLAG